MAVNDYQVANQLGQLSGDVRGLSDKLDDFMKVVRDSSNRYNARITELELESAQTKGKISGMRWLASTAFALVSMLGAERIVQIVTGLPHV